MKRNWTASELIVQWTLQPEERALLGNKIGATRLGFAVLFKFFQFAGCFPRHAGEVPPSVVDHIAREVSVPPALWPEYRWKGSTIEYHRAQIRFLLGFREPTVADGVALTAWLDDQVGVQDRHVDRLKTALLEKYRLQKIEPPSPDRVERMVRSAVHAYDERLCETVWQRLPMVAISNECGRLIANVVTAYNSILLSMLLNRCQADVDKEKVLERLKKISPVAWQHIHFLGHYLFRDNRPIDLEAILEYVDVD